MAEAPRTVHDKYAEIQKVFQTSLEIQKLAEKHPDDTQMRKTSEHMKAKILKLGAEIKEGVEKIKKSEVDNEFKAVNDEAQELVKTLLKKAKAKRTGKLIEVKELPSQKTFAVYSVVTYEIGAAGANTMHMHLKQRKYLNGSNAVYGADLDFQTQPKVGDFGEGHHHHENAQVFAENPKDFLKKLAVRIAEAGSNQKYKLDDAAGGGKTVLLQKAKSFLESFNISGDEADSKRVEVDGNSVSRDYRVYDLFEPRSGVEDDDQPDFTGRDEVINKAKDRLPADLKGKVSVDAYDHEKYWFSVQLTVAK